MKIIFKFLFVCLASLTLNTQVFAHSELDDLQYVSSAGAASSAGLIVGIANPGAGLATTFVGSVLAISLCVEQSEYSHSDEAFRDCATPAILGPASTVIMLPTYTSQRLSERNKEQNSHLALLHDDAKDFLIQGDASSLSAALQEHLDAIRSVARESKNDAVAHASDADILWALYPSMGN